MLATREFEERLKIIHTIRKDEILDVYIYNIDKPMYYSDSIVSKMLKGKEKKQFLSFYRQRKGKVQIKDDLINKLNAFYLKRQKKETLLAADLYKNYLQKKKILEREFINKKSNRDKEEYKRKFEVFNKEFDVNLSKIYDKERSDLVNNVNADNVSSQSARKWNWPVLRLPKRKNKKSRKGKRKMSRSNRLRIRLSVMGRKNIDTYVRAINDRRTINYTSPYTGKSVDLKYSAIAVKIVNKKKIDKLFVYLIPIGLSNFNRMESTNDINFTFKLNGFLKYRLLCLAYINDSSYYFEINEVESQTYQIELSATSEKVIKSKLVKKNASLSSDINNDMDFYKSRRNYNNKLSSYIKAEELRLSIGQFLFPTISKGCLNVSPISIKIDDNNDDDDF